MYRKFSADYIFDGYRLLQHRALVTDTEGQVVDLVPDDVAGEDVERFSGILSPGFINAHCHLELSHMRGMIPKGTGLAEFALQVVLHRHADEVTIGSAIDRAENEMRQNGIVAVGDICNNALTIPQKKKGRLLYQNFIEVIGFPPDVADTRFKQSEELYKSFTAAHLPASVVPHAPYSVSPELFRLINQMPDNRSLSIHNQETADENLFTQSGSGNLLHLYKELGIDISFYKPPGTTALQSWLPFFDQHQTIIAVHNVSTSAADLAFAVDTTTQKQTNIMYCLCPNANAHISNSQPDVSLLMQHTADFVLGTDSLASNDQLCILAEMKTLQENFSDLDLQTLLRWATINGAKALQLDESLGSFEKGKTPGLVLIEQVHNLRLTGSSAARRIL